MSTAALLVIAKLCRQPRCPLRDEWIALATVAQLVGVILQTEGLWVQFSVREHALVVGLVPVVLHTEDNQLMFLSHMDVSLPLFLSPFPSL